MRPSDDVCKSDGGSTCALCYLKKKLLQRDNTIKNVFFIRAVKLNETLRLNQYEKPFSPFFFTENFVISLEQNLFSRNPLLYFHCYKRIGPCFYLCAYRVMDALGKFGEHSRS